MDTNSKKITNKKIYNFSYNLLLLLFSFNTCIKHTTKILCFTKLRKILI